MRTSRNSYKKEWLEKDRDVRRWYDNLQRGSPIVADKSVQRLGYVCHHFKTTPQKIAAMGQKDAYDLILDVVTKLVSEHKSYEYMRDYVKVTKSWLQFNGITITQKIRIPENDIPTKVQQEQSPTPDLFARVLNACNQRQKVECTLVGFAGLREEVLGNYLGHDGLKVSDLPELEVVNSNQEVRFSIIPTLIIVRKTLSKAGHRYFTFYPEQGCQYLKELLEFRIRKGEKIQLDSPIDKSLKYHNRREHIRTANVGDSMRFAIRRAGFDWRPYILRTYFDTRMMMAEADGLIIRDWRVFWMGHKGDMEHRYTLNKGRLPEDLIEKMREAFASASERYIMTATRRNAATQDLVRSEMNRLVLEMAHFSPEEIEALGDLSILDSAQVSKILEDRQKTKLGLSGNSQKVVLMAEVEQYITQGWEYVRDLPPSKAIIRLPNSHTS